jgi:nucleotide-binding universal stress UspA family protein
MSFIPTPKNPTSHSMRSILLATDFLASSTLALEYAMAFASHYRARLLLVHAFELTQAAREAELFAPTQSVLRKDRQARLEVMAERVARAGITTDISLVEGPLSEAIVSVATQRAVDLLVLGTHGIHRGLAHLLLGSNTEALLQSAPCPTLTVGRHVLGGLGPNLEFKKILYMSDFTLEAAAAASYAVLLGKEFGASVDVCHLLPDSAIHNPELQKQLAYEYCEAIKRIFPSAEHDWCTPAYQLKKSALAEQILERAKADEAGLIVLGMKTETHLGQNLHTNVVYQVLAKAVCPIITVRA